MSNHKSTITSRNPCNTSTSTAETTSIKQIGDESQLKTSIQDKNLLVTKVITLLSWGEAKRKQILEIEAKTN